MAVSISEGGKGFRADIIEVTCKDILNVDKELVKIFNSWVKSNDDRIVTSVFPPKLLALQDTNGGSEYYGSIMFFHGPVY